MVPISQQAFATRCLTGQQSVSDKGNPTKAEQAVVSKEFNK